MVLFGCTKNKAEERVLEENTPMMQQESQEKLPTVHVRDGDVTTFKNDRLQEQLDSLIASNAVWSQLVSQKKMCVSVLDLSQANPKYAAKNGDFMMYAASLPKIGILYAAECSIHDGKLPLTPSLQNDLRQMISRSSNAAATRVYNLVGVQQIEHYLRDDRYHFYNEAQGGGLWVGKAYGQSNGIKRDPLKNLSHAASVNQVAKYYYLLYNRALINPQRSEHMLQMLVDPHLTHKFVHNLKKLSPEAKIYRKSGTWKTWHADSAMVESPEKDFVLVALIDDARGEQIIRDLTIPLAKLVSEKQKEN